MRSRVYASGYCVYGILCESRFDGSLSVYIGSTQDFWSRYDQHRAGRGAKFTKSRKILFGARLMSGLSKQDARRMERQVKRWDADRKRKTLQDLQFKWEFGE